MLSLRAFHRWIGFLTLLAFLLSGAYMKLSAHPERLDDGRHLLFVSRHIYILGCALVHLSLGAYVAEHPVRATRTAQWVGSSLLAASSLLLLVAFYFEPVAGHPRSAASTFGIFTLFGGVAVHLFSSRVRKRGS